jgi:hypothetical protein
MPKDWLAAQAELGIGMNEPADMRRMVEQLFGSREVRGNNDASEGKQ